MCLALWKDRLIKDHRVQETSSSSILLPQVYAQVIPPTDLVQLAVELGNVLRRRSGEGDERQVEAGLADRLKPVAEGLPQGRVAAPQQRLRLFGASQSCAAKTFFNSRFSFAIQVFSRFSMLQCLFLKVQQQP